MATLAAICRERSADDGHHAADGGAGSTALKRRKLSSVAELEGRVGHGKEKVGDKRRFRDTCRSRTSTCQPDSTALVATN